MLALGVAVELAGGHRHGHAHLLRPPLAEVDLLLTPVDLAELAEVLSNVKHAMTHITKVSSMILSSEHMGTQRLLWVVWQSLYGKRKT